MYRNLIIPILITVFSVSCGGGSGSSDESNTKGENDIIHDFFPESSDFTTPIEAVELKDGSRAFRISPNNVSAGYLISQNAPNEAITYSAFEFAEFFYEYKNKPIWIPAMNDLKTVGYNWIEDRSDNGELSESSSINGNQFIPGVGKTEQHEIIYVGAENPSNNYDGYVIYRTSSSGEWNGIDYFFDHTNGKSISDNGWNLNSVSAPYDRDSFLNAFPQ